MSEELKPLADASWFVIGSTDEYAGVKHRIAHICRDVTRAACIDEICIADVCAGFREHGYEVVRKADIDALRAERDALRDLHREICVALEQRGYQAFANEDIGKLIDQITHDHKIQFSRAEQAEMDNFRLRKLIRDAVDCWFNHDKRGDHAEMQAMYALRDEIEFPKGGEE